MAHAGEVHETAAEATAHRTAWYVQLPLFFLATLGFAAIVYLITKKQDLTILITATVMLLAGFGLFQIAPFVSVAAITAGLVGTLFTTLAGLGTPKKVEKITKKS